MEDSSTNPYIPQESDTIRQQVYQQQSPLGRIVKWSMITTGVVAVLVGIGLYFIVPRTSAVDQQARQKLADALQPPDQVLKRVNVESSIGFKLNYDNRVYSSYAEVGDSTAGSDDSAAVLRGQTYENNDLRVLRAYNYVRIRPIQSVESASALVPLPPEFEMYATVDEKDLTRAAAVPENKDLPKLSLFVKIDGDKRLAKRVADDKTIVTIEATKPTKVTIGDIDYQKVRYTTTNTNYRIPDIQYDDCYYTIQLNRPYSICASNVRPTNVSAASLVESIFGSITYQQSSQKSASTSSSSVPKKVSYRYPLAILTQATSNGSEPTIGSGVSDGSESPLITLTPAYYTDAASLSSIAINQPSVVRVGMLYCTDLSLKYESGETATTLSNACVGSVATGVFVSKNGYIATTGHAVRSRVKATIGGYINLAPDKESRLNRLQLVLDYLLKAKIIMPSDADYLKTNASIGDQEALAKIENIGSVIPDKFITANTPDDEAYTYAVQLTDKPIVVNRNDVDKPSFAYSDSVIKAKHVASNYEVSKSTQEVFTPTVDTGLLKVDGDYPDVMLAAKEEVKGGDRLNIIGYPAYTDSSLTIDKIRNLPVVTMTKVGQAYQKDGTRLVQTDVPILPGNDGAPVFNSNGQLVGFAVYGLSYCPDQQCFGNGTVRSVAELQKLIYDKNLRLSTGSQSASNWRSAVTDYMRANYTSSASAFTTAGNLYGFNRWADPLHKLAVAGQGTPSDTSLMNLLMTIMIISLIVLIIATVLLAIAYVIHRRRINALQVGHYGTVQTPTAVPAPYSMSSTPVAQTALPPVQPQQITVQKPPAQMINVQYGAQPTRRQVNVQQASNPQQTPIVGGVESSDHPVDPMEDPFYK